MENTFEGLYLGSIIKKKKDDPNQNYGCITLYFYGSYEKNGVVTPWYSVQDTYLNVESMNELTKDIPFNSKIRAEYENGFTPGSRKRLVKLTVIE